MLLLSSFIRLWDYGLTSGGFDFYHFWLVPRAVAQRETSALYSPSERVRLGAEYLIASSRPGTPGRQRQAAEWFSTLQPTGTPFFYAVLWPLTAGGYAKAYWRYQTLSLFTALASILILTRLAGHSLIAGGLVAAVMMDWFEPMRSDVRAANVNRLLLGVLTLALYAWSRRSPRGHMGSGLVLGLACMFKPVMAFVAALLVLSQAAHRRHRALAHLTGGLATGATLGFLGGSWFFGSARSWLDWATEVNRILPNELISLKMGNYAPTIFLLEQYGSEPFLFRPFVLAVLGAGLTAVYARRPRSGGEDHPAAAHEALLLSGLGFLAYVLIARLVWLHYFVLTAPIFVAVFAPRPGVPTDRVSRLIVGLGTSGLLLLSLNPLRVLLGTDDPLHHVLMLYPAIALLLAAVFLDLRRTVR